MGWKLYSWFFAIILVSAHISLLIEKITLGRIIDAPISLVALVGLFAYSYRIKILKKEFWRILLILLISWDILYEYFKGTFTFTSTSDFVILFLVCLITIPEYIALYKYSFTQRIQWDQSQPSNEEFMPEAAKDAAPHNS